MIKTFLLTALFICAGFLLLNGQNMRLNGAIKYQTITGLGVNANPQSWNINPEAVKKVVDQLIDSMGCTSFRLMFDDCDWEYTNDNDDPNNYNWKYYDSIYSLPRFMGIWEMMRYLNSKGITDITLSPDGASPKWMGGTTLMPGQEFEYAEMISSMVNYAAKRLKPAVIFNRISPINESTCGGNEGVLTIPKQFGDVYSAVATHLMKDGIDDVYIIGPDDCGGWEANFKAILSNDNTMKKVKAFGQHAYGNDSKKADELVKEIKSSHYPKSEAVMTEVNAVCENCDGGVYNADYGFNNYAGQAYQYILQDLNVGINEIQIWEAYDSRYHHPNRTLTWSMWGIFAINDTSKPDVYTKRPHFDVMKQLFTFVKPGYKRIDITTTLKDVVVSAFSAPTGKKIIITGINNSDQPQTINGSVKNTNPLKGMSYYYSDEKNYFIKGDDVMVSNNKYSKQIPPHSVFTFVSN